MRRHFNSHFPELPTGRAKPKAPRGLGRAQLGLRAAINRCSIPAAQATIAHPAEDMTAAPWSASPKRTAVAARELPVGLSMHQQLHELPQRRLWLRRAADHRSGAPETRAVSRHRGCVRLSAAEAVLRPPNPRWCGAIRRRAPPECRHRNRYRWRDGTCTSSISVNSSPSIQLLTLNTRIRNGGSAIFARRWKAHNSLRLQGLRAGRADHRSRIDRFFRSQLANATNASRLGTK